MNSLAFRMQVGDKGEKSETTYGAAETTPDRTLCPFCQLPAARIVAEDELAVVIRDAFPVSKGHTIIGKRPTPPPVLNG